MSKSKHTEAQMIAALKQVEAGRKVEEVARKVGVSKHTLYAWKAKYGGMDVSEAHRSASAKDQRPVSPGHRRKELSKQVERSTSRQTEVAPISAIFTLPGEKLTEQTQDHDNQKYGAKAAPRILTPFQAAELLECDDKTITRWARQGYIPAHPIGQGKKKYWRFFEDELIAWLTAQKNGAFAA